MRVLHIAAENGGIRGGRVGGIGDVVRDAVDEVVRLPQYSCDALTVIPSYNCLHRLPNAELRETFEYRFYGREHECQLHKVTGIRSHARVSHYVLHYNETGNQQHSSTSPVIYRPDPPDQPFATDAARFAQFAAATVEAIHQGLFGDLSVIHLHDWHAAFVLFLLRFGHVPKQLSQIRTVYTIHNLTPQGLRPFRDHESSLEAWYPDVQYEPEELCDPDYQDCINPVAVGVRFADAVHAVSPTYAEEILRSNVPERNSSECSFYGGEGLECDLQRANRESRLFGILNGACYDNCVTDSRNSDGFWSSLTC